MSNKIEYKKDKFIRYREDDLVYRLYFESGCHTLSKRKCGHLIHDIIDKCREHNTRFRNDFKVFDNHVEVYCYVIKTKKIKTILVDIDFWEKHHMLYISCQEDYPQIFYKSEIWRIHRLIMGLPNNRCDHTRLNIVDHLSGNTYDNRKSNLRLADFEDNARSRSFFSDRNDSGVSGVTLTSNREKWRVRFANEDKIKAVVFSRLSDAIEYRYIKGKELGFHFREGSTTIEDYIRNIQ